MRLRRNIDRLAPAELDSYRNIVAQAQAILDNRGFGYHAGVHGWPQYRCQHHTELFLPWHRAYLYAFELALADLNADAAIPWWDWTALPSDPSGVPQALLGAGNVLVDAPVPLDPATLQVVMAGAPTTLNFAVAPPRTRRAPGSPAELPSAADVEAVLDAPTFLDFSARLEDIHDGIHGWVGGAMSVVPLAAFDPIFWSHHAMIDRLWYLWQLRHPGALPPDIALPRALDGFTLTVAQTLDIGALGYDYALEVVA
jgi:tyrosinase